MLDAAAGDLDAARQRFAAALHLDPSMSHVRCAWARAEAAAGHVQQARELFQAGAAASPGHVPLLHVSAAKTADAFRHPVADSVICSLVSLLCLWPLLYVQSWAELEARQGRTDEARKLLQRALQTSPSHAPSWLVSIDTDVGHAVAACSRISCPAPAVLGMLSYKNLMVLHCLSQDSLVRHVLAPLDNVTVPPCVLRSPLGRCTG